MGNHNSGRNPKWEDPEAFEKAIDEYFEKRPYDATWSGLALHLGFESRQSLWEYGKKENFALPIKRALLRIEILYEEALKGKNPTGSIFALKNIGWKDKQELENKTEHSGGIRITWEDPDAGQDKGTAGELPSV